MRHRFNDEVDQWIEFNDESHTIVFSRAAFNSWDTDYNDRIGTEYRQDMLISIKALAIEMDMLQPEIVTFCFKADRRNHIAQSHYHLCVRGIWCSIRKNGF